MPPEASPKIDINRFTDSHPVTLIYRFRPILFPFSEESEGEQEIDEPEEVKRAWEELVLIQREQQRYYNYLLASTPLRGL